MVGGCHKHSASCCLLIVLQPYKKFIASILIRSEVDKTVVMFVTRVGKVWSYFGLSCSYEFTFAHRGLNGIYCQKRMSLWVRNLNSLWQRSSAFGDNIWRFAKQNHSEWVRLTTLLLYPSLLDISVIFGVNLTALWSVGKFREIIWKWVLLPASVWGVVKARQALECFNCSRNLRAKFSRLVIFPSKTDGQEQSS